MSEPTDDAPRTLVEALLGFAEARPNEVALRHKTFGIWREISWAEYGENVAAVGHGLWDLGVRSGDHVAIISDNRPEWLYADLGAQGIGARSVGIYQTNPPEDVRYVLRHSDAKVLFCEDQEQVDKAIAVRNETPRVERVVIFDPRGTRHYEDPRLVHWEAFAAAGHAARTRQPGWFEAQAAQRDPKAPAMVIYTSGTTGPPKGAMISNANVMGPTRGAAAVFNAQPTDTLLSYLPLCHVAEKIFSLFLPLQVGAVVHFGESIETVREDLVEVSPTVFLGVPRIWEKMHAGVALRMQNASWLKRRLFDLFTRWGAAIQQRAREGPLRAWDRIVWAIGDILIYRPLQERLGLRRCRLPVTGAAPISPDLIRWFNGVGVPLVEGYGQTECTGVSHANPVDGPRHGTVGKTLPGLECAIGPDGEILLRGPGVFVGYLHDEAATRATIDPQGWLATGDLGVIDPDGYLTITGRKKEIIITAGGKNLSPEKIENALKMSGFIKEAVAIGDRRKFVSALIQIDSDAVADWADRRGITYTSFEDLTAKPEVIRLVEDEVDTCNQRLAQVEQIRMFRLFPKELHQDDGELTPTQKVRRRSIGTRYERLIESMYA